MRIKKVEKPRLDGQSVLRDYSNTSIDAVYIRSNEIVKNVTIDVKLVDGQS